MAAADVQAIHCPLCSFEFLPVGDACHTGCPLSGHCHMICCPNCGYQMVDAAQSKLARWLRKLWPARKAAPAQEQARVRQPLVLSQAPMRTPLTIQALDGLPPAVEARFGVLGLLPGAEVQLLQRRPAPIVRVGETDLAIGLELLDHVRVVPGPRSVA
jgi:Fe2+ transport system protein FeoA